MDAPTLTALRSVVAPIADDQVEVLPEMGKAIVELTAVEAARLDATPGVTVAADETLSITDAQENAPWNLDRLDQSTPSVGPGKQTGQYWYPHSAGASVRVYIVDTGTWAGHAEFTGRILDGYDAITQIEGPTDDCNGHGTGVASAAAGTKNGVAKLATIVPVKAANCQGQASVSAIVNGLNWIAATNPQGTPAVINISLGALDKDGSAGFAALEEAVTSVVDLGFFVSIAAGNDGSGDIVPEACQFSPARAATAFTTGAADAWADAFGVEGRATFSNAGSCIDAFAPGVNIMTASLGGGEDAERNGTSFAAPMVAGLAAIHLADHVSDTPQQTTDAILSAAQKDALVDTPTRGLSSTIHYATSSSYSTVVTPSPNLLVRTPAQLPDTSSVVANFRSTASTDVSLTFAWDAPEGAVRLAIDGGGLPSTSVDVAGGTHIFTGLTRGTVYKATATTLTDGLLGGTASAATATTGGVVAVPSAVQNLTATLLSATATMGARVQLAWALPNDPAAPAPSDYVVQSSADSGAWATYADGVSTALTFTTPSLSASTSYAFRVYAVNTAGAGAASAATDPIRTPAGTLTTATPTIAGMKTVGSTLTATPGTWGPATATLAYQWYRTGVAITGATAKTYKLTADDFGRAMTVKVTGSLAGYTSAARTSAATVAVAKGTLSTVIPTITGTKKVGYRLTATPGTWGPATVTLGYQWYRTGVAITGATAKTYTLSASDRGKTMMVKVTGSKAGYTSAARTSTATTAVVIGTLIAPTPTISGTKRSGYTLTANPGTWGPGAVTLTYRWYRSGVPITGATAKTYKLVSADRYDTIRVRVTGVKAGYTGVGRYSASTVKIP